MLIGVYCLVLLLAESEGVIVEKQKSVCNDHCSVLQLHCPRYHRIAIREALYGVHAVNSLCPVNMECSDVNRDICCEMVGGMDCLFPYPLDHLNSFHTNCSGKVMCSVEMDHKQAASSACSSTDHRNMSSYSLVDYVCVNETFTAEICSETEISVIGRTLFAIFNPHDYTSPLTGTSCTCTARSHQWRTSTNYISSFAVDLRLTTGPGCSDAGLYMASGGESQDVTCETSKGDSWFLYPFVSILNATGDSMAKLTIGKNNPDFVWIGFEGSFDEDIVLTCKREKPPKPKSQDVHTHSHGESTNTIVDRTRNQQITPKKPSGKTSPAGIAIGTVLGLVVMAVIALVILWLVRRKSKKVEKPTTADSQNQTHIYADADEHLAIQARRLSEPLAADSTYSTVEEMATMSNAYSVPWEYRKSMFDRPGSGQCNGAPGREVDSPQVDSDGFEDVYFTPVQERKKTHLQNRSSDATGEDLEHEYVSVEDIKKNKRARKKVHQRENPDVYDQLEYSKKSPSEPPPGYSKLGFFTNKGFDSNNDHHDPDTGSRPVSDTRTSRNCDRPKVTKSNHPSASVGDSQRNPSSDDLKSTDGVSDDMEMYANSKRNSACYVNAASASSSPYELAKPLDTDV